MALRLDRATSVRAVVTGLVRWTAAALEGLQRDRPSGDTGVPGAPAHEETQAQLTTASQERQTRGHR